MSELAPLAPKRWRSPEELVAVGFERSRVVMMNEAHSRLRRSIRTREVGRRVLPAAHEAGARHLAMEALERTFALEANATRVVPYVDHNGYLSQPEMRALIGAALEVGWTLVPYEADLELKPPELEPMSRGETNWREDQQARNLVAALSALPVGGGLLVWSGNHHLARNGTGDWRPMGLCFRELAGFEPFAIDQIASVEFGNREPYAAPWVEAYADVLGTYGGAAGFLAEEAPDGWLSAADCDAYVLALDNALS